MDARAAAPAEQFESSVLNTEVATAAAAAGMSATQQETAAVVEAATRLLQSAVEWTGKLPSVSELPCAIDDDDAHARVQGALEELRRVATKSDAALAAAEADGDTDDEE